MINFNPIDEETGIEDYPGYVGMTWDGELSMSREFKDFEKFDWANYIDLIESIGGERDICYAIQGVKRTVTYDAMQDIGFLLDQLITIEVHIDDGGAYGGMASGSGYIFFLKDGYNLDDAVEEINALTRALGNDFESIQR